MQLGPKFVQQTGRSDWILSRRSNDLVYLLLFEGILTFNEPSSGYFKQAYPELVVRDFIFIYFLVFQNMVSLCRPGCPGTHSVAQTALNLEDLCFLSSGIKG